MALLILLMAAPQFASATSPDYFPQHNGDSHRYAGQAGNWTDIVTSTPSGGFTHSNYWADKKVHVVTVAANGDVNELIGGNVHLWYQFTPSAKWIISAPEVECVDGAAGLVDGFDDVKTPAGTFAHCIRLRFQSNCADAGPERAWFAPGVGLVQIENESYTGPHQSQLASARVNGRVWP